MRFSFMAELELTVNRFVLTVKVKLWKLDFVADDATYLGQS
jgi:hypothetical protein